MVYCCFLQKMLGLLFFYCPAVLQSEKGSETLPDNPTLPAPQDLIPPLFRSMLISKKNTDFMFVKQSRGGNFV